MLIARYLSRNLVWTAFFIAVALTLVIFLTQSLRFLELIVNSDAPVKLFLQLIFYSLPKFLEVVLPISLTCAILFTYNRMTADNEVIVMRASGISPRALARPALTLSAFLTAGLFVLSLWLTPVSYAAMQQLKLIVQNQYSALLLREGVFNTVGKDLTVYLRERTNTGELRGIMIHDSRDRAAPPVTITARRGIMTAQGDTPHVVVYDGLRQQLDIATGEMSRLYFNQYTVEVKNNPEKIRTRIKDANELTFGELLHPSPNMATAFSAEAHNRLLTPVMSFNFTLIALGCLLGGNFDRRGHNRKVILAVISCLVLESLFLSFANLSKKHLIFVSIEYATAGLPFLFGLFLLTEKGEAFARTLLLSFMRRKNMPIQEAAT